MSAPTVLVFGAGGAIGEALIEELLPDHEAGRLRLVGSARRPDALRGLRDQGVEARHLDLNDAEPLGCDRYWRHRSAEPAEFYANQVAAGADPVYMSCVRNVFERTRNGTLRDPGGILPVLPELLGRPARPIRDLLTERRADFMYTQQPNV